MKVQPKSYLMKLLSLVGAALFLIPLTAQAGTLTIVKNAQPKDAQDFAFYAFGPNSGSIMPFLLDDDTGAVGANNSLSNTKVFSNLAPGSYSIKEDFANPVTVTGWMLDSITCTGGGTTVDMSIKAVTVNLTASSNVICTFTNKKIQNVPIVITTPPPSGTCMSNVVVSGLHYPSQTCAQSTPNFLSTLLTSFHFKSKCTAPNQLLGVTNASCQDAPIPGFPNGSVYQGTACCGAAPPGTGTLNIVKKVSQPPSTQAFNFTMVGPGLTGAQLDDDGINGNPRSNSKTFGNVAAGVPLTVTEDAVAGWTVSSIVCLPASGTTVNLATRTLTATLTAGANVTCTFTNSQIGNGKLTLKKVLVPTTDPGKFTLAISTSSGNLLGNFLNGGHGATAGPMTVPTGNYVVSETAGSTSPTTLAQYTSVISGAGCATNGNVTIAAGDNKVCTITNTRIPPSGTWPNTATVNIYNPMTPFGPQIVNIAAGGTVTFNNVNSGANWTITWLSGPMGFPLIPLANNATGVTVPLTVPGTYTYVISGTPSFTVPGQIIVH